MEDKEILSVGEVAQILGIGRATAYMACKKKLIPSKRIGKRILISRKALIESLTCEE